MILARAHAIARVSGHGLNYASVSTVTGSMGVFAVNVFSVDWLQHCSIKQFVREPANQE